MQSAWNRKKHAHDSHLFSVSKKWMNEDVNWSGEIAGILLCIQASGACHQQTDEYD